MGFSPSSAGDFSSGVSFFCSPPPSKNFWAFSNSSSMSKSPSFPSSSMLLTMPSMTSKNSRRTSISLGVGSTFPLLTRSKRFSILWATLLRVIKPIVAAVPLRVCASLKIWSIMVFFSSSLPPSFTIFSRLRIALLRLSILSLASARNSSRYCERSSTGTTPVNLVHCHHNGLCDFTEGHNVVNHAGLYGCLWHSEDY